MSTSAFAAIAAVRALVRVLPRDLALRVLDQLAITKKELPRQGFASEAEDISLLIANIRYDLDLPDRRKVPFPE